MKTLIIEGAVTVLTLTLAIFSIRNPAAERFAPNRSPRLNRRDRVELVARLWVA